MCPKMVQTHGAVVSYEQKTEKINKYEINEYFNVREKGISK